MAVSLLQHPEAVAAALGRASVRLLVWGFAFLPLFAPRLFVVACLPPILVLALSPDPDYHRFRYYNSASCLGPLGVAAALGLRRLIARPPNMLPVGAGWCAVLLATRLVIGGFDKTPPHLQRDVWRFGLAPLAGPFPVTAEARNVRALLRRVDTSTATIAAGPQSYVHLRHSARLRLFPDWESRRPDLIVLARELDFPLALYHIGVRTRPEFDRRLRGTGYRMVAAPDGLEVWARNDVSAAASARLLGNAQAR